MRPCVIVVAFCSARFQHRKCCLRSQHAHVHQLLLLRLIKLEVKLDAVIKRSFGPRRLLATTGTPAKLKESEFFKVSSIRILQEHWPL